MCHTNTPRDEKPMTKTNRFFRTKSRLLGDSLVLTLLLLALAGCFGPDTIVVIPPTPAPELPTPVVEPSPTPKIQRTALQFPLAAPVHVSLQRDVDAGCIACHTDANALQDAMSTVETAGVVRTQEMEGTSELLSVEPWTRFLVDSDKFQMTLHGRYGCIGCHKGNGDTMVKEVAHQNMRIEPSREGACTVCHAEEAASEETSLHTNLTGYRTVLVARSDPSKTGSLETMMSDHCDSCHTTGCGQCHVSLPETMGGGLVAKHLFKDKPAINLTCGGCHGSRIESEYKGHNSQVPGDVHWVQGNMLCSDCHLAAEFHGKVEAFVHRYDGRPLPDCLSAGCHPSVAEDDGIQQHGDSHLKSLSCQACHATSYQNCYGCHVGIKDGQPYSELSESQWTFKIGRNPLQNRYRPWKYVPVRHVPITRDSFASYGENVLSNFDAVPTWKYATPHNIQRITPQSRSCNSCHGNDRVFLTAADVATDERNANRRVIVEIVPEPIE